MREELSRTRLLLGEDALERIARSHVAVFGVGGVGSYAVEALARSGIGAIDIIDNDKVCLSNINRQLIALHSTLDEYKVDAALKRIKDINPDCKVTAYKTFYMSENRNMFDFATYDYILDAIDTVTAKLSLIEQANAAGTLIISAMGAGNKLDPTAFRVADIYETKGCPLARVMRRECKKRGIAHLKVVYSTEEPVSRNENTSESADTPRPRKLAPGSIAYVPSVAGLIMAGEVIKTLSGIYKDT